MNRAMNNMASNQGKPVISSIDFLSSQIDYFWCFSVACNRCFCSWGETGEIKGGQRCFCLVRCLLKWSLAPSHYSAAPYMFEPFSDVYLFMIQFYILHQLCHLKNLSHLDLWDCLGMRGTLVSGEIALLHDK